jgi:hypothetical protein
MGSRESVDSQPPVAGDIVRRQVLRAGELGGEPLVSQGFRQGMFRDPAAGRLDEP